MQKPIKCDPDAANRVMGARKRMHDQLQNTIREAIMVAINPDPNVVLEDKLCGVDAVQFRQALASAAAELLYFYCDRPIDEFIEDVRVFDMIDEIDTGFWVI